MADLEVIAMIVIRVFDVLDGLCSQMATHVMCCGSGTCPEPDAIRYETRRHDAYEVDGVVAVVAEIIHDQLSAVGDAGVSAIVQNHLNTVLNY